MLICQQQQRVLAHALRLQPQLCPQQLLLLLLLR
jgi:hypothetical protein